MHIFRTAACPCSCRWPAMVTPKLAQTAWTSTNGFSATAASLAMASVSNTSWGVELAAAESSPLKKDLVKGTQCCSGRHPALPSSAVLLVRPPPPPCQPLSTRTTAKNLLHLIRRSTHRNLSRIRFPGDPSDLEAPAHSSHMTPGSADTETSGRQPTPRT